MDLMDLYLIIIELALSGKDTNKSFGKFYFGSVGEHAWGDAAKDLAPILYARGLVDNPKAISIASGDGLRLTYVIISKINQTFVERVSAKITLVVRRIGASL